MLAGSQCPPPWKSAHAAVDEHTRFLILLVPHPQRGASSRRLAVHGNRHVRSCAAPAGVLVPATPKRCGHGVPRQGLCFPAPACGKHARRAASSGTVAGCRSSTKHGYRTAPVFPPRIGSVMPERWPPLGSEYAACPIFSRVSRNRRVEMMTPSPSPPSSRLELCHFLPLARSAACLNEPIMLTGFKRSKSVKPMRPLCEPTNTFGDADAGAVTPTPRPAPFGLRRREIPPLFAARARRRRRPPHPADLLSSWARAPVLC